MHGKKKWLDLLNQSILNRLILQYINIF